MNDEELRLIADGIITAQATAFAARAAVRELLIDIARLRPDPIRYADELYDRAVRHVDPDPGSGGEKPAVAFARELLGAIFRDATAALREPPASPNPRGQAPRRG